MSRCFPYPPPGYIPSRASNEALIESIKLQKEKGKDKSERKKEKKEKKREKKEKKKSKEEDKAKQIKTSQLEHNVFKVESQKEKKDDTEQLERSSITEEHEQPSQNPSYSSDSTQNSGCKRKRHDSPVNSTRVQGGNILRFRLPSQKQIKHDVKGEEQPPKQIKHGVRVDEQPIPSSSLKIIKQHTIGGDDPVLRLPSQDHRKPEIRGSEDQPSTSGRADVLVEDKNIFSRTDLDKSYPSSLAAELKVNVDPLRSEQRWIQQNSGGLDNTYLEDVYVDSSSRRFKKMKKVADKYKSLIEDWTPPCLLRDDDDEKGDDWLFGSKNEATTRPEKMLRAASTDMMMTCSGSSTLWPPRAQYLPEADVYALPYTIPF
ncbi:OLC1v1018258C1 [Oldenlandia corymbosa var. corymbosa]|uniref:OLC1v1018258C1 n=1 Tax=Oldenlandia corymbosa var. corymbosa TaxID=529605 RepID=A0AAV1EB77_OLDCO|nr:OLC1v1018258C1 [Oldenlandia corymbosa var. corymbosa]